jgi:cyclophilin family peptidyl-prolyl cis-trans isomerase
MARQQAKRRRKKYQPGSAYAGDVKPTGIFSLFGDVRFIRAVFIIMAVGLVAGGFSVIFASDLVFTSGSRDPSEIDFVLPEGTSTPEGATPQPTTFIVRQYSEAPEMVIDTSKQYVATIKTSAGDITVELFDDQAPQTVNSFVFLARDGFYDGLAFVYADGSFSANAGDPACRPSNVNACAGDGGPGYDIREDVNGQFEAGVLGMVNASQFFIALTDSDQFEGYPPLGRITSGLEVARQLTKGAEIQTIEINES